MQTADGKYQPDGPFGRKGKLTRRIAADELNAEYKKRN